jgi:DTW domain-containing protein YfiP
MTDVPATPADPPKIANRIEVLILRHPQEKDAPLGTASLLADRLEHATLRTGLSWANLARALGTTAEERSPEPRRWLALYLGTKVQAPAADAPALTAVDPHGVALPDQAAALAHVEGIVLLDGNWRQAKALWWRNAWLLKLRRAVLNPERRSAYGALRREPRRESISTIEAAALTLDALGDPSKPGEPLMEAFVAFLKEARRRGAAPKKRDWRRKR